jgi:hypothetical protein
MTPKVRDVPELLNKYCDCRWIESNHQSVEFLLPSIQGFEPILQYRHLSISFDE